MNPIVLEKLEWRRLVEIVSENAQTQAGRELCLGLLPNLDKAEILHRWDLTEPMKELMGMGFAPPISDIREMNEIFRYIRLGQLLNGEDIREVWNLLNAIRNLHKFSGDFESKCLTLKLFRSRTYPLPGLMGQIEKTVGEDGELLDTASEVLQQLRKSKVYLRRKIEKRIHDLFGDVDLKKYLQDTFFTLRSERYVVPIKLDGRGRIKGSIYDTSDSGQTLFIEPSEIAPMNEELQEIELSEKIEILRIFRELGELLRSEIEVLTENYQALTELDFYNALGQYAFHFNSRSVPVVADPCLKLVDARHPLLQTKDGSPAVPNTIELESHRCSLIVSGPNAGGKTVILKTVGLIHLMAKAGLLLPVEEKSEIYLFQNIFLELGDAQSLSDSLSTFSGHIFGLKPIIDTAQKQDLVLLDELAGGTEPQAGAALAQAIVEELVNRESVTIVSTHFDTLKALAMRDQRIRNASMEFSDRDHKPTYRLVLDIPGQSFGLEVAEQMGLSKSVIARARQIRGGKGAEMDELIRVMNEERIRLAEDRQKSEAALVKAETERAHWIREKDILIDKRSQTARSLHEDASDEFQDLRIEYENLAEELRKKIRDLERGGAGTDIIRNEFQENRHKMVDNFKKFNDVLNRLQAKSGAKDLLGRAIEFQDLKTGDTVFTVSLNQRGQVLRKGNSVKQNIDILVGGVSVSLPLADLRFVDNLKKSPSEKPRLKANHRNLFQKLPSIDEIPLTIKTSTNFVDLRGMETTEAMESAWRFIDKAVRSGEPHIMLIHGHGHNKLKVAIRNALSTECPYKNMRFRPGGDAEGGDGVTIVALG